jgi:hypothetical protein
VTTQEIMAEPPEGDNHGVSAHHYVDADGAPRESRVDLTMRLAKLDQRGLEGTDSRYGIVDGKEEGGLVAHRGVLADGEYVDFFALREQLEEEFGFTYADVALAYKNGRPTATQLQLRVQIDARVLELSRAGGNMAQFAQAVGVSEKAIDRALMRARLGNPEPTVKRGVVKRDRVCFKCEAPAKRRKRRFSTSPPEWTGTIDLCDDHYAAGFEDRPGNPAYWEFRDDRRPIRHAA